MIGARRSVSALALATLMSQGVAEAGDLIDTRPPQPPMTAPGVGPYITPPPNPGIDDRSLSGSSIGGFAPAVTDAYTTIQMAFRADAVARLNGVVNFLRFRTPDGQSPRLQLYMADNSPGIVAELVRLRPDAERVLTSVEYAALARELNRLLRTQNLQTPEVFKSRIGFSRIPRNLSVVRAHPGGGGFPIDLDAETGTARLDDETLAYLREIIEKYQPPVASIIYGADAQIASNSTFSLPDLTFSSNEASLDLGVKPLFGKRDGYLIALRHELTRYPLVARYRDLWLLGDRLVDDDRTVTWDEITKAFSDVADEFNRMSEAARLGIIAAYSDLDGARRGSGGIAFSQMFRMSHTPVTQAVFFAVSAQADWRHIPAGFVQNLPPAPIERTGLSTAVRVGWQDQLPFIQYNKVCPHTPNHRLCIQTYRWHFKAGMEYVPRSAVNGGDTFALFLRYRVIDGDLEGLTWRQIEDRTTEFGLSVGKGPDDRPFVLLSVSRSIGF